MDRVSGASREKPTATFVMLSVRSKSQVAAGRMERRAAGASKGDALRMTKDGPG
jgi:hypothetical protein